MSFSRAARERRRCATKVPIPARSGHESGRKLSGTHRSGERAARRSVPPALQLQLRNAALELLVAREVVARAGHALATDRDRVDLHRDPALGQADQLDRGLQALLAADDLDALLVHE